MILPSRHSETGAFKAFWSEFNKLRDYVQSIAPVAGKNVRIDRTSKGSIIRSTVVSETSTPSTPASIAMFIVDAVGAGTLTCRYRGSNGDDFGYDDETDVTVAKPRALSFRGGMSSNYNGLNYVYTPDGDDVNKRGVATVIEGTSLSWKEHLYPPYVSVGEVGRYIIAVYLDPSQTGGSGVYWLDLNVDGRCWQIVPQKFGVCINGTPTYAAIAGGLPPTGSVP